jgi:hypothetical protein
MPVPDFSPGEVLTAAAMDSIGLWLVKTQTVSSSPAVSSVTVTDAFSADYDNYRITYTGGTQSISADLNLVLGASSTGYYGVLIFGATTSPGAPSMALNNNATRFDWVGGGSAGQTSHASFDLLGPFLSGWTKVRNGGYENGVNIGTQQGTHQVASSFSAFTLGIVGGTLTGGTIRVYGYRN